MKIADVVAELQEHPHAKPVGLGVCRDDGRESGKYCIFCGDYMIVSIGACLCEHTRGHSGYHQGGTEHLPRS